MMNERAVRWAPWAIVLLFMLLGAVGQVLWFPNRQGGMADEADTLESFWLFGVFAIYGVIGALAASRNRDRPIGWVFLGVATAMALGFFSEQYAIYALVTNPGSLPAGELIGWPTHWTWSIGLGLLLTFSLLLFPNGRLPSPRWRWVAWLSAGTMAVMALAGGFVPTQNQDFPTIRNPFGLSQLAGWSDLPDQLGGLLAVCGLLSAASLVFRYRGATATERQQLKWFSYAALLLSLVLAYEFVIAPLLSPSDPAFLPAWLFDIALAALPVATGIAILRYRLWDIDVIISRTLLYTALSIILAAVYFASVLLLQAIFQVVTGRTQSQLVTVISTLAIAVLFSPLRRGLQAQLDRRFYRRQYDATRILNGFSTAARNEVDLDRLTDDLVAVVADAMQPAHLSLWQSPQVLEASGQAHQPANKSVRNST
jgi:cytochrome bd-type quinol oxidase subunit 2